MKTRILLLFAVVLYIGSCASSKQALAPIEANYEAKTIDVQLDNLTSQMVKSLAQEKKSKIAIMEFPDLNGNVSELGKFIPEELTTRLFMTRRFEVVERSLLNKVLEEQNLGMTGLVDANSAAQIGKMLGVDAIVTGTITDMGSMIRINARIIATETASVFAVSSASIDKEPHIVGMMQRFGSQPAVAVTSSQPQPATTAQPVVAEQPKAEPTAPAKPELPKTNVDDFEFEVVSASLSGDNKAQIVILVTNKSSEDKELFFSCHENSIFDNLGQEYRNAIRKIGNKSANGSSHFQHLFIKDLPTRISFEYSKVDPNAISIALLNLGLSSKASLRNIELEKQK